MQKGYVVWIIVAVLIFIGLIVISLSFKSEVIVDDFESCVKAGNPVMESYPRRCNHNGETYIEDISKYNTPLALQNYFSEQIMDRGIQNLGAHPIEGFNPELYKMAFPNLIDSDFDGVDAYGGIWRIENGNLIWIVSNLGGPITSADGTLTNIGLRTFLDNLSKRLNIEVKAKSDVNLIINEIELEEKIEDKIKTFCKDEQRNVGACITLYDPVCGWNDPDKIQCITFPCASTYSNSCEACSQEGVLYWTKGECPK